MTIKILNGGRGREVNASIMAHALLGGCSLKVDNLFVYFEVERWRDFCSFAYHAYCELSRDSRGVQISKRIEVDVEVNPGLWYHTQVWCDVENRCLRYASLY